MDYEGIYRKTGGMSQVKQITQSFQRLPAFRLEDTEWDISAITSVLKNYFRELPIPLFTFDLHDDLVSIAGQSFVLPVRFRLTHAIIYRAS